MSFSGSFFVGGSITGDDTDAESVRVPAIVNESVTAGDLLRPIVNGAFGFLEKADDLGVHCVGVATANASAGDSIDLLQFGVGTVNFSHALTDADRGKAVYVSSTAGQASLTAPTASGRAIIRVGFLQNSDGLCLIMPMTIVKFS